MVTLIVERKEYLGVRSPKFIYDQAAGKLTQFTSRLLPSEKRSLRFGLYDFSLSQDFASKN